MTRKLKTLWLMNSLERHLKRMRTWTRNGRLSISIKIKSKLRVWMKNSDLKSTDHSTLSPDSHSRRLWNSKELLIQWFTDMSREELPSNGTSMELPRQSSLNNTRTDQLKSKETVMPQQQEQLLPTQDGGNSSSLRTIRLSTSKTESVLNH